MEVTKQLYQHMFDFALLYVALIDCAPWETVCFVDPRLQMFPEALQVFHYILSVKREKSTTNYSNMHAY